MQMQTHMRVESHSEWFYGMHGSEDKQHVAVYFFTQMCDSPWHKIVLSMSCAGWFCTAPAMLRWQLQEQPPTLVTAAGWLWGLVRRTAQLCESTDVLAAAATSFVAPCCDLATLSSAYLTHFTLLPERHNGMLRTLVAARGGILDFAATRSLGGATSGPDRLLLSSPDLAEAALTALAASRHSAFLEGRNERALQDTNKTTGRGEECSSRNGGGGGGGGAGSSSSMNSSRRASRSTSRGGCRSSRASRSSRGLAAEEGGGPVLSFEPPLAHWLAGLCGGLLAVAASIYPTQDEELWEHLRYVCVGQSCNAALFLVHHLAILPLQTPTRAASALAMELILDNAAACSGTRHCLPNILLQHAQRASAVDRLAVITSRGRLLLELFWQLGGGSGQRQQQQPDAGHRALEPYDEAKMRLEEAKVQLQVLSDLPQIICFLTRDGEGLDGADLEPSDQSTSFMMRHACASVAVLVSMVFSFYLRLMLRGRVHLERAAWGLCWYHLLAAKMHVLLAACLLLRICTMCLSPVHSQYRGQPCHKPLRNVLCLCRAGDPLLRSTGLLQV